MTTCSVATRFIGRDTRTLSRKFSSISVHPEAKLVASLPEAGLSLNADRRYACEIIGAPMSYGQPLLGTEMAPRSMRQNARLQHAIESTGWNVIDSGDVHIPTASEVNESGTPMRNASAVGIGNEAVFRAVRAARERGSFSLVLGGDHSIGVGSVSGALKAQPETAVLWVDAHADINRPEDSPSGNLHGMPLAFLLRLVRGTIPPAWAWLQDAPPLLPSRLVYIGLRDVDAGEKLLIHSLGIKAYTMSDIDRLGIGQVMSEALGRLMSHDGKSGFGNVKRPLHLSFDIDAVDPSVAPSTGTAVPGGLNFREAHYLCEACAETGLLASMDMVEVNPQLGRREEAQDAFSTGLDGQLTVKAAVSFIESALGKSIL